MKVDARKNRLLINQFPFIKRIIHQNMLPDGYVSGSNSGTLRVDNLTIRVQKADGDLLFRQAQNTGLGDHSMFFSMKKDRNGQVGRMGEYIFAVDARDEIMNRLDWPLNDHRAQRGYPVYARQVMWATRHPDGSLSNPIWDKIVYLVWVTVSTWHKDTGVDGEPESRFGECLERNLDITVYGKPDCGFKELEEQSSIWSNLRLNQSVTNRAIFERDADILQILGCQWELCKFFQEEVWDKGMKQAYDQFKTRGASGQFGPTKVLVADMCDYHRVIFENNSCWISFQLRPGAIDMYVLGQDGTLPQLRQLVRSMVLMWIQNPGCHANFKADENVSVM